MADYARMNGNTLQTPVHRYADPRTGRRVTLIGTVHVGEPGYFENLRGVIEKLEADGAQVQCEAARRDETGPTDLTRDETDLLAELRRVKDLEELAVAELGWTGQIKGLGYPERWKDVDMPGIEIIRAVGADVFLKQARRMARFMEKYKDEPERAQAWFRAMAVTTLRVAARSKLATRSRGDDVIVDNRTDVALAGVDSTDLDLVLIWGALHLPGLDLGLRARGFSRVATDWHDAAQLPGVVSVFWQAWRRKRRPRRKAHTDRVGA